MASLFGLFPFLLKLYVDSGYTGPRSRAAGSCMGAKRRGGSWRKTCLVSGVDWAKADINPGIGLPDLVQQKKLKSAIMV
jgi:hypothetical protein